MRFNADDEAAGSAPPGTRLGRTRAREQLERTALERPNRTETAVVEGQQAAGVEAGREHNDCSIGEPEVKIRVPRLEFGHRGVLLELEALDGEATAAKSSRNASPAARPIRRPSR